MPVDTKPDTPFQEAITDLAAFECEDTFLARNIGEFDRLVNQVLRCIEFLKETFQAYFEGAEEITDGDAHQGHGEGSADDDQ